MIHPDDYHAMETMFRGAEPPEDLVREYEIQRRMADAYGHSGALGMNLVIPMMRRLGYGKIVEKTVENVDWRAHIGEEVIAQYGDQKVSGKVIGLGSNSRLVLDLQGHGEVELPRYSVQLAPTRELVAEKDAWANIKRGTKVTFKDITGVTMRGTFLGVSPAGVLVKCGKDEFVLRPEFVELAV